MVQGPGLATGVGKFIPLLASQAHYLKIKVRTVR